MTAGGMFGLMPSDPGFSAPIPPQRLYVHLAWSTLARVDAIAPGRRAGIETHMMAVCRWVGAEPVEACALGDRVHLIARIPAVLSVHVLAQRLRREVADLLARSGCVVRWSTGFAAVTITPAEVRRARRRLANLGLDAMSRPRSPSALPTLDGRG